MGVLAHVPRTAGGRWRTVDQPDRSLAPIGGLTRREDREHALTKSRALRAAREALAEVAP